MTAANDLAVRRALEMAGVEFIDENGGGPGVRLRKHQRPKWPNRGRRPPSTAYQRASLVDSYRLPVQLY